MDCVLKKCLGGVRGGHRITFLVKIQSCGFALRDHVVSSRIMISSLSRQHNNKKRNVM